ncbi:ABC transporter ATP-binding protein [Brevibacterium samyangense]|uniref:ABC transporter ATP-binding protein n=1 Tax=Brevibacterium samyangense TaxID=366888 RepID=A0ABP5F278_9MICO
MDPAIRGAAPRGGASFAVVLAWIQAAATALLFVVLGRAIDGMLRAEGLLGTVTAADPTGSGAGVLGSGVLSGGAEVLDAGAAVLDAGFWTSVLVCVLLAAVAAGAGALHSQYMAAATERGLRQLVVKALFDRGAVASSGRSGELLSLSTSAVERAATYRGSFLGPITGSLTTPFLVLALMAGTVSWRIAGALALLLLLVPLLISGFRKLVRPIGAQYRRSQGRLTAGFLENIQALETLVQHRAADRAGAQLAARGEEHRRGLMKMLAGNQLLILVVDGAFSLTVLVTSGLMTVHAVAHGTLTLGAAVAVVLMTVLVIGPVDVVGQFFYIGIAGRAAQSQIGAHIAGAGRGARSDSGTAGGDAGGPAGGAVVGGGSGSDGAVTGEARPAGASGPSTRTGAAGSGGAAEVPARGALVLDGVTAGWPGEAPVLRNVSLRIDRGERVALVGESGVGKSTLSALVQGHLVPRAGSVSVDGVAVTPATAYAARSRIAVVEQSTFLFVGSIADNLRIADPDASEDHLWEALDLAGLAAEVRAMPLGLDTPVGEHGALLSGGQAQRLSIARAWLRGAPVLVLDEPTSQVDLAGEAALLEALDRLAAHRTVLMIAHRPNAILAADRVLELTAHGITEVAR